MKREKLKCLARVVVALACLLGITALIVVIVTRSDGFQRDYPISIRYVDGKHISRPANARGGTYFWLTNNSSFEAGFLLDRIELKEGTNWTRVYHYHYHHGPRGIRVFVDQGSNRVEVTRPSPRYSMSGVTWTKRSPNVLDGHEDVFYRASPEVHPAGSVLRAKFLIAKEPDGTARLKAFLKTLPDKISGEDTGSWNPFSTNISFPKKPIELWVETEVE